MTQAIAFTSRLGYLSVQRNISGQKRAVYEAIRDWTGDGLPCNDDLASATGLRLSSICGRVNELREQGCIEDAPMKQSPITGHPVKTYRAIVYREPEQKQEPVDDLFPEAVNQSPRYF